MGFTLGSFWSAAACGRPGERPFPHWRVEWADELSLERGRWPDGEHLPCRMTRDDVTGPLAGLPGCRDWVAVFLDLTEEAQRLYLHILQGGIAEMSWGTLVDMLTCLQDDERTCDLVTRLGNISRSTA